MPATEAALAFPAAPQSAGAARRFVRHRVDDWHLGVATEDVVLMVSELVTNVGRHARTEATVRVRFAGDCLRIEVSDASPQPVQRREHSSGAEAGRGLLIVDALAAAWGVEADDHGKTVWFEVPATRLASSGRDGSEPRRGGGRPAEPQSSA